MEKNSFEILKNAKLKATKARLSILNIFSDICKPLCAEDIYKKVDFDLVTIYRTLTSFERVGILKKINLQKESIYYEPSKHHHHHIICTDCGLIEEFQICEIEKISKEALKKATKFDAIKEHSLELFGICKTCLKM
jgi:Fur family ferric uptake transcriptional regulator